MYPDETQSEEQKDQSTTTSDNINEIVPSPWDLDEEVETQVIPTDKQSVRTYKSTTTQPIDAEYVPLVEENSTDTPNIKEKSTTPPVTEIDAEYVPFVEENSTDTPNIKEESTTPPFVKENFTDIPNIKEEPTTPPVAEIETELTPAVNGLQQQEENLKEEIAVLQQTKAKLQQEVMAQTEAIGRLLPEALNQLESRRQVLQVEVEKLERRKERIQKEMRTTFAGASQDLAIRIQGFKDYLVGSLQDLALAAEQLELTPQIQEPPTPSVMENSPRSVRNAETPQFAEMGFEEQARQIRLILDEYRKMPDYYGPPWKLRRTFEPIHAERVSNWFFSQGGRGALRTMGSRLQNILLASTIVSVLRDLYDTRVRALILANSPERLGEWRRGLQDCLGIDRRDFSPDRGVALFEEPEVLAQKADRLVKQGKLPLIIIDDTEDRISLSMLQFPLWLAFAPEPGLQNSIDRF
ncbi:DUF3086 domain-containing protein [Okeania hirsuta]|uniref:DUF3086 domain-containing protein n=1 Tax=Okeania TaxID=1458928 RepID=UPI000F5484CE|nr:DUF3086 domain-containing protein [Okeania sp. SIO1H4]NET15283.1 DUF3086 domain-containing protein [Okeania sp. SIO1H6]NET20229.1 DUF3086 domain-containing protein [Okeania sp. SIO1H5]NET95351.1 DUF3086 domain-containing protein [Okeania sp. SIO1H2]RQH14466.1 DUF3086 domain-containing protein [Okeania hirsuta]